MAGRRQQRTVETHRRILEAAQELVAEQSFEATSVEAIAMRAGVAKATVFAHFDGKTSLLIALHLSQLEALATDLRQTVDALAADPQRNDACKEILALLSPWLALYREDPDFARLLLIQSTLKDGPHTRQFIEACSGMEAEIRRALSVLAERGALRPGAEVTVLTQGVMAFYYHVIVGFNLCHITDEIQQTELMQGLLARLL
ncbi:helix-turn-helix domain-containing protein [Pannonibacter sp. Pt2-lr]|uniref:Helix-turn-helix domain-containing protein n=1 Tax=Pannonibacter anstelovis TaxID=3121537 RepID=A0ABU7ZR35_9HYPH